MAGWRTRERHAQAAADHGSTHPFPSQVDSELGFAPSNYSVRTTSKVEWFFVHAPEGRLGKELPEGLAVDGVPLREEAGTVAWPGEAADCGLDPRRRRQAELTISQSPRPRARACQSLLAQPSRWETDSLPLAGSRGRCTTSSGR